MDLRNIADIAVTQSMTATQSLEPNPSQTIDREEPPFMIYTDESIKKVIKLTQVNFNPAQKASKV